MPQSRRGPRRLEQCIHEGLDIQTVHKSILIHIRPSRVTCVERKRVEQCGDESVGIGELDDTVAVDVSVNQDRGLG